MQHETHETKPQAKPQAKPEPEPLTPSAVRSKVSWIRQAGHLGRGMVHNAMIGEKQVAQVEEDYGMSGMKVYGVVGGKSYSLIRDAKVAAVDLAARSLPHPPPPPPKAAVSSAPHHHQ